MILIAGCARVWNLYGGGKTEKVDWQNDCSQWGSIILSLVIYDHLILTIRFLIWYDSILKYIFHPFNMNIVSQLLLHCMEAHLAYSVKSVSADFSGNIHRKCPIFSLASIYQTGWLLKQFITVRSPDHLVLILGGFYYWIDACGTIAQCPRCQVGCSGSKNLPTETTGG